MTNKELVKTAGSTVIGTQSGLKAQQAQAELNKRMIESMNKLRESLDENNQISTKYNNAILNLTIAMALLAVLQIFMSAFATNFSWPIKIGFALAPLLIIIMVIKDKS